MPAKRLTAPEPKTVKERLQRLVSKEYNNEANYSANVVRQNYSSLLRSFCVYRRHSSLHLVKAPHK